MNATTGTCTEHMALLEEYRVALRHWRVARANDPLNSQAPAVLEATKQVEELERKLRRQQIEYGRYLCEQRDL
jgi:hypothetical protein